MLVGNPIPTIWDVPDDLWERVEPVILEFVNAVVVQRKCPPKCSGKMSVGMVLSY